MVHFLQGKVDQNDECQRRTKYRSDGQNIYFEKSSGFYGSKQLIEGSRLFWKISFTFLIE